MRLLMLYPNQFVIGSKPLCLSYFKPMVEAAGGAYRLFDLSDYLVDEICPVDDKGEELLFFKKVRDERPLPPRVRISREELRQLLVRTIREFQPDLIGLTAVTINYGLGLELLRMVRDECAIPVIAGGIHPTVLPEEVLGTGLVDYVCVGEGEAALAAVAKAAEPAAALRAAPNIWHRAGTAIIRNPVGLGLGNLDELPCPDWSQFSERQFYKPYKGRQYRIGDVERSRGCPYRCSYCTTPYLHTLYGVSMQQYYRQKSNRRLVAELTELKRRYGIEFFRFWDESFLLMAEEELAELAGLYRREIGVPFVFETTAESVTPAKARLLREMNCVAVRIGVEVGNERFRREVLKKPTGNEVIRRAFAHLQAEGINVGAFNMIGLPGETRALMMETIAFNKELAGDSPACTIFTPYPGTPLYASCREHGLLLGEEFGSDCHDRTRVKLPDLSPEELVRLRDLFMLYIIFPEYLHPLLDQCGLATDYSRRLTASLREIGYRRLFGDEAPAA